DTSHPTTASIATRPCLSSASLMNFAGKMVANPNGSKPMSPTMPSRFSGCFKKGMDADIAGPAGTGSGAASGSAATSSVMRSALDAAGELLITREKEEGATNAEAQEAHARPAPTVEM
ncbi:unnamed protein product, partial [Ectocarpus sp. 8 AP-2014]